MIFQSQKMPASAGVSSFSPPARNLQRKCACGGTPGPSGECAECKRKRLSLQPKLAINQPGDRYEQEADRVADAIVGGASSKRPAISSLGAGTVQREEPAKPKTEEEKYKEAAKKVGEAFLQTPPGKEIEKKAEELGDAFISTLPGKIITGVAVSGAIATLAATHKELPIGIPEIPLNKIKPGLKMKITYDGPVDKPSKVMVGFSFKFGGGKAGGKKSGPTESEKRQAETARRAAEDAKFREGLRSDEDKAADAKRLNDRLGSRMLRPDQLTPRTSPLSFGVAGEQLGFHPGAPAAGPRSSLGPLVPDFKLSGETQAAEPKKKEEQTLQRKSAEPSGSAPVIVDQVLQSSGQPLDSATRADMERRFGYDFANVRIHRDAQAAASARAVGASAYTVGSQIAFDSSRYAPETTEGRRLLAHELTHVVQQQAAPAGLQRKLNVEDFEGGKFDTKTLETYLAKFGPNRIEDHNDSDDKARTIVQLWRKGKMKLDPNKKILLIREMQSGFTGDDDERAILTLLLNSPDQDLLVIFAAKGGIDPKDLDSDFQGPEEDVLRDFYDRKFEGGRAAALKGSRKLRAAAPTAGEKAAPEQKPAKEEAAKPERVPRKDEKDVVVLLDNALQPAAITIAPDATVLTPKSPEDLAKQLKAIKHPINRILFFGHADDSATIKFPSGWTPPAKLSTAVEGAVPVGMEPDLADFRGCRVGMSPPGMEQIRVALRARAAVGATCWIVTKTVGPFDLGQGDVTSPTKPKKYTDDEMMAGVEMALKSFGKARKCVIDTTPKAYFRARGKFVAAWFSPRRDTEFDPLYSRCYAEVTPTVVDPLKVLKGQSSISHNCQLLEVDAKP